MFKDLINYKNLLWAFTLRNIAIRYKETAMGYLWAIFMPLIIVLSGVMVKFAMSAFSGKALEVSQIVSVSVKALPWAFFVGTLKFSVTSLVGNSNLVQKIYFPKAVLPLSFVFSQFFDFAIASATLVVVLLFAKVGMSISLIWLPVLIILLVMLTAAFSLIFACGTLFFRDVKYIVDVVLTFGIFFTPVFYDAKIFGKWENLLLLNPIGSLLECVNNVVVLHRSPDLMWFSYTAIWAIGGFFAALAIFNNAESAFAENI